MQREKMIWMRKDGEWMRCGKCGHKLFRYAGATPLKDVEVKCHSCKQVNACEPQEWWVFTFGYGQEHAGRFVRFFGTYGEARNQMHERFGNRWAFQYSMDEWLRNPHATEQELVLPDSNRVHGASCEVA